MTVFGRLSPRVRRAAVIASVSFVLLAAAAYVRFCQWGLEVQYCIYLEGRILPDYYDAHKRWPSSLGPAEAEFETAAKKGLVYDPSVAHWVIHTYYHDRPAMIVTHQDRDVIRAHITFAGGYRGTFSIHAAHD